ncbi:potassium channel family protein [Lysinibacillus sp. FSL K6-3209]|uniref:potassium channel family protein n=1 Tax=Lysinibacillus sp. FSL K6-3209 TaxID=2921497 RepID=UPI0030D8076A
MKKFLKKLTTFKPYVYGGLYLILIPLYAILFTILPESGFQLNNHHAGFYSSFYFSIVTITTLGYGDITPIGKIAQFLVASEAILGIILIGLFLNSLSHQHGIEVQKIEKLKQQKKDKDQAKERFSAFNRLVELKIKRYRDYLIPITTPLSKRDSNTINEDFSFNDMQDLYLTTARLTDDLLAPAIQYYYESLEELLESIEELVKLGYIHHWPDLEYYCLKFIEVAKELDTSAFILSQPNTNLGSQKAVEYYAEMIKNHKGEVEYIPGGNSINPYISLYYLILHSLEFTKKYREMALEIIEDEEN